MRVGLGLGLGAGGGSPWTPSRLVGNGLTTWLRADMGLTLSGSAVISWADQSGSGRNWTDGGSATRRPAYSATSFNNRPGITFDGSSDYLTPSSAFTFTSTSTIALVAPASALLRTTAKISSSTGFRSQSASGTSPVSYTEERVYSATTTDATQTTIGSITPPNDCVVDVVCTFTARKSSGSGTYRSNAKATYEVADGVVTLVGTVDSELEARTNTTLTAGTIDTSGGAVRARVTGRVGETWRWTCEVAVTIRTTGA